MEIERFLNAMKIIRDEIREVESGALNAEQSPLRFAPHTPEDLLRSDWDRKYPVAVGAFPDGLGARNEHLATVQLGKSSKYWPFVGRIDGAYGDRNLICSCPSPEEFQ
jgi:glycine dehydrogenase